MRSLTSLLVAIELIMTEKCKVQIIVNIVARTPTKCMHQVVVD